mgnify:CR=1 FL=1
MYEDFFNLIGEIFLYSIYVIMTPVMIWSVISVFNFELSEKLLNKMSKPMEKINQFFPNSPSIVGIYFTILFFLLGVGSLYYGTINLMSVGTYGMVEESSRMTGLNYEMRTYGSSFWDWFTIIGLIGGGLFIIYNVVILFFPEFKINFKDEEKE